LALMMYLEFLAFLTLATSFSGMFERTCSSISSMIGNGLLGGLASLPFFFGFLLRFAGLLFLLAAQFVQLGQALGDVRVAVGGWRLGFVDRLGEGRGNKFGGVGFAIYFLRGGGFLGFHFFLGALRLRSSRDRRRIITWARAGAYRNK
jgi:hypothetical protein